MEARQEKNKLKEKLQLNQLDGEDKKGYLFRLISLLFTLKMKPCPVDYYKFLCARNQKSDNLLLGKVRSQIKYTIDDLEIHSLFLVNNYSPTSLLLQFAKVFEITLFQMLFRKLTPLLNEHCIQRIKCELEQLKNDKKLGEGLNISKQTIEHEFHLINSWLNAEIEKFSPVTGRLKQ